MKFIVLATLMLSIAMALADLYVEYLRHNRVIESELRRLNSEIELKKKLDTCNRRILTKEIINE